MVAAVLALVGFLISLYLWLWKVGLLGALLCGDGGCEIVQLSEYAELLGIPVALFGMVAYLALLALSLLGLQPRWQDRREPTVGLVLVAGAGVAYSAYLTYLEAAVIHAWCRWCVASAVIVSVILVVAVCGLRAMRRPAATSGTAA
jgi:uncharacterized membrane protein